MSRELIRAIRSFVCVKSRGLNNVGKNFLASKTATISRDLVAGDYVYIGSYCMLYPNIEIGSYTMFGPGVIIMGEDHRFDVVGQPMIFSGRPKLPKTVIGEDVWIGARAFIRCGVNVGSYSIVAAGSVVTKDVEDFSIVAGVPAKPIGVRFSSEIDKENHRLSVENKKFNVVYANRIRDSVTS